MDLSFKRAVLLCLASAAVVLSSPLQTKLPQKLNSIAGQGLPYSVQSKSLNLAKTAALQWNLTGVTIKMCGPNYCQAFLRDTIIYGTNGLNYVRKSTLAQTGWGSDSLRAVDSAFYENGKIVKYVHKTLNNTDPYFFEGQVNYTYYNEGKTVVMSWADPSSKGAFYKDSIVSADPISINNPLDYFKEIIKPNLVGKFSTDKHGDTIDYTHTITSASQSSSSIHFSTSKLPNGKCIIELLSRNGRSTYPLMRNRK